MVELDLQDLHLHNIDLHYHAGQERQPGLTVQDYVAMARMTGRRVLGITDHLGFFWPGGEEQGEMPYPRSLEGLARFRADVEAARTAFPDMLLLFGPELSPRHALAKLPDPVIERSDYLILETAYGREDVAENTANLADRIREAGAFTAETGLPTFIAHPFRSPVIHRLMRREIEPWVTALTPRPDLDYTLEELNRFFALDLPAVGRACRETDVPLDVNGGTHNRVRTANLPPALQMLWAAYAVLRDAGATFVPGSDQHHIVKPSSARWRTGSSVPWDCFDALGLTAADIAFLQGFI